MKISKAELLAIAQQQMSELMQIIDLIDIQEQQAKNYIYQQLKANANGNNSIFEDHHIKPLIHDDPIVEVPENLIPALKTHYSKKIEEIEQSINNKS